MISFFRIIKFALQNIRRNKWLSVAVVLTMFPTLILLTFVFILNSLLKISIVEVKEKIDIGVFLEEPVQTEEVLSYEYYFLNKTNTEIPYTPQINIKDLKSFAELSELGAGKMEDDIVIWPQTVLKGKEEQVYKFKAKVKSYEDWPFLEDGKTAGQDIFEANLAGEVIKNFGVSEKLVVKSNSREGDVSGFLNAKQNIEALKKELAANSQVKEVKFISKAEGLGDFNKTNVAKSKDIKEDLDKIIKDLNPIKASLSIKPNIPEKYDQIIAILKDEKYKTIINNPDQNITSLDQKEIVEEVFRVVKIVANVLLVGTLIFLTVLIIITFNSLRLAIFSRKDEVEIMKLVGASMWFIRGPFIAESILYGIFGAIIAGSLTFLLVPFVLSDWLKGFLGEFGGNVVVFLNQNIFLIILGQAVIGIFLSLLSTIIALKRYLKY